MKFTAEDIEWHNSILILMCSFLKMKIKPIIMYNRELFDSYEPKGEYNVSEVWGECIDDTGLIWLNKDLKKRPKTLTVNIILHECLHIKHPDWNEDKVRDTANNLVPIH